MQGETIPPAGTGGQNARDQHARDKNGGATMDLSLMFAQSSAVLVGAAVVFGFMCWAYVCNRTRPEEPPRRRQRAPKIVRSEPAGLA